MVLYICGKFHISNGFQFTERTRVYGRNGYVQCSKSSNSKVGKSELRFMGFASRLIVPCICVVS